MLTIDINAQSQGPHWLSNPDAKRDEITARVNARLAERYKDHGKKRKAAEPQEPTAPPPDQSP